MLHDHQMYRQQYLTWSFACYKNLVLFLNNHSVEPLNAGTVLQMPEARPAPPHTYIVVCLYFGQHVNLMFVRLAQPIKSVQKRVSPNKNPTWRIAKKRAILQFSGHWVLT